MRRSVAPRLDRPLSTAVRSFRPSIMSTTTISAIRATPVTVPLEAPIRHSNGAHWGRFVRTIVEVETADGYVGLGEMGGGGEDAARAFAALAGYLRGHDVFRLEAMRFAICNPTASLYNNRTQLHAAIEFACLDIIGQKLGVPVHAILGGKLRDEVSVRELPLLPLQRPRIGSAARCERRAARRARARAAREARLSRAQAQRRRLSAGLRARVLPRARRRAPRRSLPLRSELRALARRRDRFRPRHRGPRERLLRRPRLGNAAARAPEGIRVDTDRHEHGRRRLRAACRERRNARRRRRAARHDVLGRHPALHQGGRRLRDDGNRRRRAQLGRARHSARDDAAPGRGAAEHRLRRRRALPSSDRRRDRRREDEVPQRRDRRPRRQRARRRARSRQAPPLPRALSGARRLSVRSRSRPAGLVSDRAESRLGRPGAFGHAAARTRCARLADVKRKRRAS